MPILEYDYSSKDYQLVANQETGNITDFDYVRLIVLTPKGKIVNLDTNPNFSNQSIFYSSLSQEEYYINTSPFNPDLSQTTVKTIGGNKNDFKIYTANDGSIYVKPNDIFDDYGLPDGNYKLQIDFLRQVSPNGVSPEYLSTLINPEYFEEYNIIGNDGVLNQADADEWDNFGRPDIKLQIESFISNNEFPNPYTGDGRQPYAPSFFYNPNYYAELGTHYEFIIKQISTSRKEVRLKLINNSIENNSPIVTMIENELNSINGDYGFKHILNISSGINIPITNFTFDKVTDGKNNQSIILKLYSPIPRIIRNLSQVTIEKEILITQTTDVYYFSEVKPSRDGMGLIPDEEENWINPNQLENLNLENYNDLTASLSDASIQNLLSGSEYNYPNLNTDYRFFENHTFFGSAKRKLENFKNKITTIQGYYGNISSSLSSSGVSIDGDPNYTVKYREDLFNKIDTEIKTFTPYETFLYFDGQGESTASAPGLGQSYAHPIPVSNDYKGYQGQLDKADGLNTVYHYSNQNTEIAANVNLFTDKYRIEDKPFFNYEGGVYLSFLMKADDGVSLTWEKTFKSTAADSIYKGYYLPEDSFYQNTIASPQVTGSQYQRFIFEASQSYWAPTIHSEYDISNIECWEAGSNEIEIISGSIKTGSSAIRDSSGIYQNLTNVVTASGVPFFGSVLPNGELFKIFYETTLSQSLSGSWNLDSQTSGAAVTNAMLTDFSGRENTGSVVSNGTIKISDGVEVHGKQYGKSILFVSESNDDIRFFSDKDFNYTRDDNFSLSVWAKRFHSNTGSADPTSGNAQAIFTRGFSGASYGIDYNFTANQIRAGVRGQGSQIQATFNTSDDLLEWNHIAFTYESGSSTGIKLYVNGELKDSESTGDGYIVSGESHFSASAANIGGDADSLSIGSNDAIGGTSKYYNGFIQYPRVYNRTISQTEVKQLYHSPEGIIDSKLADVRVSINNPTNVLPFDNIYHTGSTEWTSWYDGMYDSASAFDTDNINSLENNLPLYIQESNDYGELKDFLSLQGEQYDVIRNHVDSLGTLNNRGYTELNSPPKNTLPMLLNNMGWEAINPFSGSLSETLGSYLSGITSIDDIKNNTWRKTLNNLLYVYKTKGTQNSVRGLMNIYGYPPDVLKVREFGGTTGDAVQQGTISDSPPDTTVTVDTELNNQNGSIGYVVRKEKLWNYMFQGKKDRGLELDWWMDDADINTIEFIYKHKSASENQTILKSSGSLSEHLWDLRLLRSSDGVSSSFEFRLNNSNTGSGAIADNGVSMSLDYTNMTDGQIWNVMLQRATGSVSGSGTNEYRLHAAIQDGSSIQTYNYVTMSINGGSSNTYVTGGADSNYYANQNWSMTGSRHYLSSSNLAVGEKFSGSLSQIKGWTTTLSHSKFRKHTLNKFSTMGNIITSHCKELVYHFKLNENYTTSSISSSTQTLHIIDSAPKHELNTDYSFLLEPLDQITGSCASVLYGYNIVDSVRLGFVDNNQDSENDNGIVINPKSEIIGNLDATQTIFGNKGKKEQITSNKLEINSSPQDAVNIHILNNMDAFTLEKYYGNPASQYSSSYKKLDDLRKEFFDCSPILVNTNEYIRAQENIFNKSVTDAIQSSVPARSTLSDAKANIGVTIKPSILERQKYEHEEYSIEVNPNSPSGSLSMVTTGSYQNGFIFNSTLELPYSSSLSMGSSFVSESLNSGVVTPNFLQPGGYTGSLELEKIGSISPLPVFTGSLELPISTSISMGSTFVSESDNARSVVPPFIQQGGVTASIEFPKSGSIEEITTQYTKEFVNIHDSWGTHNSSSHFMNYANKAKNTITTSQLIFKFETSASAGSQITLTSVEAVNADTPITGSTSPDLNTLIFKTRTYTAVSSSGTANLDYNGALSADSSSVLFLTGSGAAILGARSQALNLLAAITSSNGHDDSFITLGVNKIAAIKDLVDLKLKVNGTFGNTFSASIGHLTGSGPGDLRDAIDSVVTGNILSFTGGSIGLGDYNDGHIEPRYHFISIGDTEYYSGSFGNSDDFSNGSRFYNQQQVTENVHNSVNYYSAYATGPVLFAAHSSEAGIAVVTRTGRRMGKTRFFRQIPNPTVLSASVVIPSGKTIILPSNHVSKFSNPFKDQMYKGTQNNTPGFSPSEKYEDYSSASFYRVKVTGGENQIIVKGDGTSTVDSDDNIIY